MKTYKAVAIALTCGFILGNSVSIAQAGLLDKVIKGGVVGAVVKYTAEPLNDGINKLTDKYGVGTEDATKVVPIITVGDGSRAGAAQVSGPQSKVDEVEAALLIEQTILGVKAKVLLPIDSLDINNINRVQGVGVCASIDVKI